LLALVRASALSSVGRYQLEAAAQSARVVRRRAGRADWAAIKNLYDALLVLTGSPVVAINRARWRSPKPAVAQRASRRWSHSRAPRASPSTNGTWPRTGLLLRSGSRDAGNTRGTRLSCPVVTLFDNNVGPRPTISP